MCMSKPSMPAPPPPVQDVKPADTANAATRKAQKRTGMASGSLLTGPSGIQTTALNTGGTSLLGG
jgi:hypothetical protein